MGIDTLKDYWFIEKFYNPMIVKGLFILGSIASLAVTLKLWHVTEPTFLYLLYWIGLWLVAVFVCRMVCEGIILPYRMLEELKKIAKKGKK